MNGFINIDLDKEVFWESLNNEFENNSSLISNIEISLKRAIVTLFENILPVNFELTFSKFECNCESITLKELSEKGFFIKDLHIIILFLEEFVFDKDICFCDKSNLKCLNPNWVRYNKQVFKKNKTSEIKIYLPDLFIDSEIFKQIYEDKKELCKTDCNKIFLQEYPRHCWDILILYQCKICGKLYYCSCQKEAYRLTEKYYKETFSWCYSEQDFIKLYSISEEKDTICSLCTNKLPQYNYCHEMYGSKFKSIYGAYIQTEAIKLAGRYIFPNNEPNYKDYIKKADHYLREKLDYPIAGKKWINESYLYNVVKTIFYNHWVEREFSPKWLRGKRIDIFVHDINLAIEYQGEQHYKPVEIFGGEQGFKNTQKRDKEKLQLCKQHNINLIYFNYQEELNESMVIKRLNKYIR